MPRPPRITEAGLAYHVLNRRVMRLPIFNKDRDYAAFERILAGALEHVPGMRLLAYCLMPNHWHLVLWPRKSGQLADFAQWLTLTHTQRWHAHDRNVGAGHLYQGRYKSFPIETDEHLLTVCRYTERNALRAGLVARAEMWRLISEPHRRLTPGGSPRSRRPRNLSVPHVDGPAFLMLKTRVVRDLGKSKIDTRLTVPKAFS